ncbi:hypothetical protein Mapa_008616 [Marchantia paleacea]|nr:hypothetical protein Mapa_008616 [Marchantia paleacea]
MLVECLSTLSYSSLASRLTRAFLFFQRPESLSNFPKPLLHYERRDTLFHHRSYHTLARSLTPSKTSRIQFTNIRYLAAIPCGRTIGDMGTQEIHLRLERPWSAPKTPQRERAKVLVSWTGPVYADVPARAATQAGHRAKCKAQASSSIISAAQYSRNLAMFQTSRQEIGHSHSWSRLGRRTCALSDELRSSSLSPRETSQVQQQNEPLELANAMTVAVKRVAGMYVRVTEIRLEPDHRKGPFRSSPPAARREAERNRIV